MADGGGLIPTLFRLGRSGSSMDRAISREETHFVGRLVERGRFEVLHELKGLSDPSGKRIYPYTKSQNWQLYFHEITMMELARFCYPTNFPFAALAGLRIVIVRGLDD